MSRREHQLYQFETIFFRQNNIVPPLLYFAGNCTRQFLYKVSDHVLDCYLCTEIFDRNKRRDFRTHFQGRILIPCMLKYQV